MPFLSVIVTVYNIKAYLPKCIDSILAQTFTDFELILVDDGSSDGCGKICDEYSKLDGRVIVIHQKNKGLVNARKTGLLKATGKYVAYVDGDDWIERDMYEQMLYFAKKLNCDIVMSDIDFAEGGALRKVSSLDNSYLKNGFYDRKMLENEIFPIMLYTGFFYKFGVYPVIWNKVFKRELLLKHQLTVDENIKFGEDLACVYPCIFDAQGLYFMKHSHLYHYRYSNSQMTYTYDKTFFARQKSLYFFFKKTDFAKSKYRSQVVYYFKYALKQALDNEIKSRNPLFEKSENLKQILSCDWVGEFLYTPLPKDTPIRYKLYYRLAEKRRTILLILATKLYKMFAGSRQTQ